MAKQEKEPKKGKVATEKEPKDVVDESEETEEAEETEPETEPEVAKEIAYDVVKGNQYVRTYSLAQHGEGFQALAEQFISKPEYAKRAYSLRPSSAIKKVRVLYREKEDAEKKLDDQSPDSPIVDKERVFSDKEAALAFRASKSQMGNPASIVIV